MGKKRTDSPSVTSEEYDAMRPKWDKVQTVLDGTEAMRAAGETYLPRHSQEVQARYDERLGRATLFNQTEITLESWVGRPFGDPLRVEQASTQVEGLLDDVDQTGTSMQAFCRAWFSDGLAKAYSHVLVDFPRTDLPSEDGTPRTLATDRAEGVRPYWVHIQPERLFFASADVVAGKEVLQEIRIREEVTEMVGFAEVCQPQIRRLFVDEAGLVQVQLFRLEDPTKEEEEDSEWILFDEYSMDGIDRIPLVTFYADRQAFMLGKPPMEDLVDLNVAHWQSGSDQRAVLTVARFPILAISGGDETKKIVVGPYKSIHIPDPQGKAYYVEHGGAAIEAGRQDLKDLEERMADYGAQFLVKRPGSLTATARALDSAESTSPLQDVTLRFKAALEQVLEYTAMWLKQENSGSVVITTDFGPEELSQAEMTTLNTARKQRDISRVAYLTELKRRGLLGDEYDIEADAAQLEQEAMNLFGNPGGVDPDAEREPNPGDTGKEGQT